MDNVETIKTNKQYVKCKLTVKRWENEFQAKNDRKPSKFDIKEAPANIKYAYKKYFQLKSAALENSLSICEIDEESFGSPDPALHLEKLPSPQPCGDLVESLIPDLPSGIELTNLISNAQREKDSNSTSNNSNKQLSSLSTNLSKKLFQNKRFSIRNPRKTILSKCHSSVINNKTVNLPQNQLDVDEAVEADIMSTNLSSLHETSTKTVITSTSNFTNSHELDKMCIRQLDKAWLERSTGLKLDESDKTKINMPEKFGLRNISLSVLTDKQCDYVENSESEDENTSLNKLQPALKKRKVESDDIPLVGNDRHEESYVAHNPQTKISIKTKKVKSNKTNNSAKNKGKSQIKYDRDQTPDITEYIPFGIEENITPRHSKVSDIVNHLKEPSKNISKDISSFSKLESKIMNGTLNENFVKINIEKKVFVRGKKNISFSKYKKQQWKDKKALHYAMDFPESGKILCFKCGNAGHMARYCTNQKGDTLLPLESYDDNDIPSLEDMQNIVNKETTALSVVEQLSQSVYEPSQVPDVVLKLLNENQDSDKVKPIYTDHQQKAPSEILDALHMFGHKTFRPGQEEAIMRILCGMSTLLILSTGSGKSLCYQLPAYIYSQRYSCITLVISPLVSLMEDQVLSMPEFLKAGCLHTNQPPTQRRKVLECIKDGMINILLISPEALVASDSSNGFAGLFKSLPKIAFACIDEVHCVSQWSHNFRPSYLMICRVLREKLNVKCILGLTATASQTTIKSVISHINIPDGLAGVVTNPTLPDNLFLSVSFEENKDKALISYLISERINSFNSIIVYCIRRDECERVAALLRSFLQEPGKNNMERPNNKRKRMSFIAEAYHAGMSAAQRKKIQKHFMDGTLRIIVATVAFGMGINKPDIRSIIHYNMPSSFESYVQEVGRAGRDGQIAYCHVFINNNNIDKDELLKHIYANTIDRPTLRKLLQKVFIPCGCAKFHDNVANNCIVRCKGHEVGIPIDSTVEELDIPSENIATLLCYVELHPKKYIKLLSNAYTMCKISSYGGPQQILEAAKTCPPLAMAYILESKKDADITKSNVLEFPVIEVASAIGWESGITKYKLKNLEWISESSSSKRSQLKVEFNTLGFRIRAPGDLTSTELDRILDDLHEIVSTQEKAMLFQLEECNSAFKKLGDYSLEKYDLTEEILLSKSNDLKDTIRNYFLRENSLPSNIILEERPLDEERVVADVRALISSYKDCNFTGRSVAKIFQGISSPNFPAIIWGRTKFWRSHITKDFCGLMKIATQQIIQMRLP